MNEMNLSDTKLVITCIGYVDLTRVVEFGKKHSVVGFGINEKRVD